MRSILSNTVQLFKFVYLQKYGGGSMGPTSSIGMFGLFNLGDAKEYMVPLKYLTEEEAQKYIKG